VFSWSFEIHDKKELQPDADEGISNREHRGRALLKHKPHRFVLTIESSQINDTGTYECKVDGKVVNTTQVFVHGWKKSDELKNETHSVHFLDEDECINNFVPTNVKNLIVGYGDTFIIPCRTTRPDISVILLDPQDVRFCFYV